MRLAHFYLLGLLTLPGLAEPQGRFWLVDSNNQYIGEVAAVDQIRPWVAILAPGGEPVFVPFEAAGGESLTAEILYESTSCTGAGYVTISSNTPALRTGYVIGGNQVWATKRTPFVQISAQSFHDNTGPCTQIPGAQFLVREVEFVGNLTFTPPVHVIWNPNVLLLDGFELGNTSHW